MNQNDRFYGCESLGFPEVNNYNFEDNLPVRGIDDRNFRWEEVATPTVYMLKEATSNGSFETNSFIYSNLTGVNYITTGTVLGNSSAFNSWNITGDRTLYIGISGIYIYSGDLPGVTKSFQASPIDGNIAIGLYCLNTGILTAPAIYTSSLVTGEEGPIILDQKHQVYLQASLHYGLTGLVNVVVRGWNAGSIVAYYNALTASWESSYPTGCFELSPGISTIKYDFITSNFPAVSPTSFDLYISNLASGSFVVVDNVHLDAYFKQDAFIDYLVPSGYVIQITPDLGWHNMMDLFDGKESIVNPHLTTLGPYVVSFGNLQDNLDNTVTATIDYNDFIKATTSTYKKYLWRALPLTPNGQLGQGGYPQKFHYVGDEVNTNFTVDSTINDDTSTIKIITGTKSKSMSILVDEKENNPGLTYPTPTSWKLEINLAAPTRVVKIRGKDKGGNLTYFKNVTLTNKLYSQNYTALWNVFDEHGLVADVERLPKELNFDYSSRIKDSYRNRGNSSFLGIINGATRELNINKIPDGISLSINKDSYGNYFTNLVDVEVTSYSIRISAPSFVSEERSVLDPVFSIAKLNYYPIDFPQYVEIEGKGKIPSVDVELYNHDDKSKYYIKVSSSYQGKILSIKYRYAVEILFKNYTTLEEIINQLNSITDPSGNKIVTAKLGYKLSGNENCLGLYITNSSISPNTQLLIGWSPVVLKKLADRGYRDYYIKEDLSTLKNTKYYSFVEELIKSTKIFWGQVETDRSRWDIADSKDLAMDSIPTLFDPPISRILTVVTGAEKILDPIEAWGRSYIGLSNEYLENVGLKESFFQPGVAHTTDLQPSVYTTFSRLEGVLVQSLNIGPLRNYNNTEILFSGQI